MQHSKFQTVKRVVEIFSHAFATIPPLLMMFVNVCNIYNSEFTAPTRTCSRDLVDVQLAHDVYFSSRKFMHLSKFAV